MFISARFMSKWNSQSNSTRIATSMAFALVAAIIVTSLLKGILALSQSQYGWDSASNQPAVSLTAVTLTFLGLAQVVNSVLIAAVRKSRSEKQNPVLLRLVHALGGDVICIVLIGLVTSVLLNDGRLAGVIQANLGIAIGFSALGVVGLGLGGAALFTKGRPDEVNNPLLKFAMLKLLPTLAIVLLEASPVTIALFASLILLDIMLYSIGANFSMRRD